MGFPDNSVDRQTSRSKMYFLEKTLWRWSCYLRKYVHRLLLGLVVGNRNIFCRIQCGGRRYDMEKLPAWLWRVVNVQTSRTQDQYGDADDYDCPCDTRDLISCHVSSSSIFFNKSFSRGGQMLVLQTPFQMTRKVQVLTWLLPATNIEMFPSMCDVTGENRISYHLLITDHQYWSESMIMTSIFREKIKYFLIVDSPFITQWSMFSAQNTSSWAISHLSN